VLHWGCVESKSVGRERNLVKKQKVTLSLPHDLFLKARRLAAERGVSLSKLLASNLEELVEREPKYEEARKRAVERMRRGVPMGVGKKPTWTRDELHER